LNINPYTGDGFAYFSFSATDNAGNVAFNIQSPLIYSNLVTGGIYVSTDIILPEWFVFDMDTLSNTYINDQTVGVSITKDSRATSWLIKEDSRNPEADDVLWHSKMITEFTLRTKINALRTLYLWVKDDEGRVVTAPVITTFNYDNIDPVIISFEVERLTGDAVKVVDGYSYFRVGTYNVTFNFAEELLVTPTILMDHLTAFVSNYFTVLKINNSTYTSQFVVTNGTVEGVYNLYYSATDNAGNTSKVQLFNSPMVVDVSNPIVDFEVLDFDTLSSLYTNSVNVRLSINVSEGVSYLVTENSNQTIFYSMFNVSKPTIATFATSVVESKMLKLLVIDRAGNINSSNATIVFDNIVPTATIEFAGAANDVDVGSYRITLNVGGIFSGLATTPNLSFVPNNKAPIFLSLQLQAIGQYTATLSISTFFGDGLGYFMFNATDNAGNSASSSYCPLIINTLVKIPSFNVHDLEMGPLSRYTNDNILSVIISQDEQAYAWMITEVYSTKPSSSNSLWLSNRPVEYKLLNKSNDIKTFYLWIKNANGNINDVPAIVTINYDNILPMLTSTEIRRITGDDVCVINGYSYVRVGTYNITFNFSESVLVTPEVWLVNKALALTLNVSLLQNSPSEFIAEYVVTNGTAEGEYNVYYNVTDNAGNCSLVQLYSSSLIVDRTVSNPSIIAYDKDNNNDLRTDDLIVGLRITNDEDVIEWLVSETDRHSVSPSSNDPLWINARPYEHRFKNIQSGLRNIHLWVKDRAGNISSVDAYAFIMFDTAELEAKNYANVYVDKGTVVLPGYMYITLNVIEQVLSTPSLSLRFENGNKIPVSLNFVSSSDRNGVYYKSTILVPEIASWSGEAYFELIVTRTNFTVFAATTNRIILGLIGGQSKINIAVPLYHLVTVDQKLTAMELGAQNQVVISFNFGSNSSAVAIQKIRVVLSGNVYDNDISEIYFAYPKDGGYKELTEIGKIKNKEVILSFYSADSYFRGMKDIVLMMSVSDKAVLDSRFQVV
ncbi:MAG: hypothetical protein WCH76_06735, partial [Candidatus Riflemargulisbacteria bacterium]